jgi:N6-adenosine-specific RNA methylase IME4
MTRVQCNFAKGREKWVKVANTRAFATAIVDPDWPYTCAPDVVGGKGSLNGFTRYHERQRNTYSQDVPLSIDELKRLPVGYVVDGYVLLWTVGPFLINGAAVAVLRAWGFEAVSILTWAKYDLNNNHGYGGVGFWLLGNAEFCIIGKRSGWPSIRTGRSSLIIDKKRNHSQKPEAVHLLCEQRFPGPYVEIFGRNARENWTVLGNEAPGDGEDIRVSLRKQLDDATRP